MIRSRAGSFGGVGEQVGEDLAQLGGEAVDDEAVGQVRALGGQRQRAEQRQTGEKSQVRNEQM